MKELPFIVVNKLISEIYPFSIEEVCNYKSVIDFEYLSKNKNIQWSYELIRKFKEEWCWESLDQNIAVFKRLTLGLLFPEKLEIPPCTCFFQLDFCEDVNCRVNYNKFHFATSLYSVYPKYYIKIKAMCESGFIDQDMVEEFYETKNTQKVLRFEALYNS